MRSDRGGERSGRAARLGRESREGRDESLRWIPGPESAH